MTITQAPYNWNSVWRPIIYRYDYVSKVANSVSNNAGYARFNFATVFTITPAVGDKFIVEAAGTYQGIHEITSIDSTTQFTTKTAYSVGAGAVTVLHMRLPEIQLYRGYLSTEAYYADDPITLVATFRPNNSIDNDVRIDVSGYLQSVFTDIIAPVTGVDHTLFTRFRLYFDGAYQDYYHVLNSAIESEDLDGLYANTGRYLTPSTIPYLLDCGDTILSKIQDDAVFNYALDGALKGGEFDTDFDTDFDT